MAIRTEGLTKAYGDLVAVRDLTLRVEPGEIYGFLGPNGAGKTTTILMLLGIIRPTRGRVFLFDMPLAENYFAVKRRLGVVAERQHFYDDMTAEEYLHFFADLYEVPNKARRIGELMEAVGLSEFMKLRACDYSRGMQQKLGLVRALLHDPDLLILDEPVSGLDPYGIREVRHLLLEENRRGKTIFLSSHILSEIERTAHRVGIIHRGVLVTEGSLETLRARLRKETELEVELEQVGPQLVETLSALPFVSQVHREERRLTLRLAADADYRPQVSAAITAAGGIILAMRRKEMSLEDAFVTITADHVAALAGYAGG